MRESARGAGRLMKQFLERVVPSIVTDSFINGRAFEKVSHASESVFASERIKQDGYGGFCLCLAYKLAANFAVFMDPVIGEIVSISAEMKVVLRCARCC